MAVKYCSKLFSHGLSGAGVLMADCVTACSTILASRSRASDVRERERERRGVTGCEKSVVLQVPRGEAIQLLGSMLFLPRLSPDLRERLVSAILTAARREPAKNTRSVVSSLGGAWEPAALSLPCPHFFGSVSHFHSLPLTFSAVAGLSIWWA